MPSRSTNRRLYARAKEALQDSPWLIMQQKWDAMNEFISLRSDGFDLTEEEIAATIEMQSPVYAQISQSRKNGEREWAIVDGTAVINIAGTLVKRADSLDRMSGLLGTETVAEWLQEAVAAKEVKSIVLQIDSPGGQVNGTPELAALVRQVAESKPVVSFAFGMMASAAYWIGSAATKVLASESSMVGSVGVIWPHADLSKKYETAGVKMSLITYGAHKSDGNSFEPLGKQGKATMQDIVDSIGTLFDASVADYRGTTAENVKEKFGQGKVFMGAEAKRLGLIDGVVGSLDEAIKTAQALVSPTNNGSPRQTMRAESHNHTVAETTMEFRPNSKEDTLVNAQIKAALFSRGIIAADANDDVATAAMNGWFSAKGIAKPANDEEALKAINNAGVTATLASPIAPVQTATAPAAQDPQVIRDKAITDENFRQKDIRSRARLLNGNAATPVITEAMIETAIDDPKITGDIVAAQWTKELAKNYKGMTRVESGEAGIDLLIADASDGMAASILSKLHLPYRDIDGKAHTLSAGAQKMRRVPALTIAMQVLTAAGIRIDAFGHDETRDERIAQAFLAQAPAQGSIEAYMPMGDGGSYGTVSRLPNLLAGVATRIIESTNVQAEFSFRRWSKQVATLPDDAPRLTIRAGSGGELDRLGDSDPLPEVVAVEEGGFLSAERFGNSAAITPLMIIRNSLNVGFEQLINLERRMWRTLHMLNLSVLTSNPTLTDTYALFSQSRPAGSNYYTSASVTVGLTTINDAMVGFATIKDVDRVTECGYVPVYGLFPAAKITEAKQYLLPAAMLGGVYATSESGTNPFRGTIEPEMEPRLTNVDDYYLFVDLSVAAAVVHGWLKGYEGGKRETYYDPRTKNQYFDLQAGFGAAANNPRAARKYHKT